jgi:hypothetical protein
MKRRICFLIITIICLSYLEADVFEFQQYFYGKDSSPTSYWDRRYRYTFEGGLLTSIETSLAEVHSNKILEQYTVNIQRYVDRIEAYKNDKLYLTIYYVDSDTMYMVFASRPTTKSLIIKNNNEVTFYVSQDTWRIKILLGEEVIFRINNNNIYPYVDFIITGKDTSSIRYDKLDPDGTRYEKIREREYEWVTYREGMWREELARYVVIPASEKYKVTVADFIIDYFCGEGLVHLFWGQLITRSENRLSAMY